MKHVLTMGLVVLAVVGCSPFSPGDADARKYDTPEERRVRELFEVWRDAMINANVELVYKCLSTKRHLAAPYHVYLKEYNERHRETKELYAGWEASSVTVEGRDATVSIRDASGPTRYITFVLEQEGWKIDDIHYLGKE